MFLLSLCISYHSDLCCRNTNPPPKLGQHGHEVSPLCNQHETQSLTFRFSRDEFIDWPAEEQLVEDITVEEERQWCLGLVRGWSRRAMFGVVGEEVTEGDPGLAWIQRALGRVSHQLGTCITASPRQGRLALDTLLDTAVYSVQVAAHAPWSSVGAVAVVREGLFVLLRHGLTLGNVSSVASSLDKMTSTGCFTMAELAGAATQAWELGDPAILPQVRRLRSYPELPQDIREVLASTPATLRRPTSREVAVVTDSRGMFSPSSHFTLTSLFLPREQNQQQALGEGLGLAT